MAEVFISYSQKDRALVAPIAARLAELGVDAWYDREISAGERFGAVIRARLKEAKAVLACWSPEAIQSDWVEAEADYARELGSYVPVFVAPCALMPPFNRIHTDDLSKWTGAANDAVWIKLIDRIAKIIGREGVAAAARAFATGDEQALYDFARRYPDEPTARKVWSAAEARHREQFEQRMTEARSAANARIDAERAAIDANLLEATQAFEVWLENDRRGAAKEPPRDPLRLIEQSADRDHEKVAALQSALAQAKVREGELDTAKSEIARQSRELAALKAQGEQQSLDLARVKGSEKELETAKTGVEQLRAEIAVLNRALAEAKTKEGEQDSEAPALSARRAAASARQSRRWAIATLASSIIGVAALAGLIYFRAQVVSLNADLATAQDALRAADEGRTEFASASQFVGQGAGRRARPRVEFREGTVCGSAPSSRFTHYSSSACRPRRTRLVCGPR